jgi:hypothetical protein
MKTQNDDKKFAYAKMFADETISNHWLPNGMAVDVHGGEPISRKEYIEELLEWELRGSMTTDYFVSRLTDGLEKFSAEAEFFYDEEDSAPIDDIVDIYFKLLKESAHGE